MIPEPEDLIEARSWTDWDFARWLSVGLHDYRERGRDAFPTFYTFIGVGYAIEDDLTNIYVALPGERSKAAFRAALAIVLAETPIDDPAVETILTLARRTKATHVLPVLARKILGDWRKRAVRNIDLDDSIVRTAALLSLFAGDSELTAASVGCLVEFSRSEFLPPSQATSLFFKLCEVAPEPNRMAFALHTFWPLLDRHFGKDERSAERPALIAEAIALCGRGEALATLGFRPAGEYGYTWWHTAVYEALDDISLPADPVPLLIPTSPVIPFAARRRADEGARWEKSWDKFLPTAFIALDRHEGGPN